MYGETLDPKRTAFGIGYDDTYVHLTTGRLIEPWEYNRLSSDDKSMYTSVTPRPFKIYIEDLDETDNDDIRGVDHPLWDILWCNECECVFKPMSQKSVDPTQNYLMALVDSNDARVWLLSIGMVEDSSLAHNVGG